MAAHRARVGPRLPRIARKGSAPRRRRRTTRCSRGRPAAVRNRRRNAALGGQRCSTWCANSWRSVASRLPAVPGARIRTRPGSGSYRARSESCHATPTVTSPVHPLRPGKAAVNRSQARVVTSRRSPGVSSVNRTVGSIGRAEATTATAATAASTTRAMRDLRTSRTVPAERAVRADLFRPAGSAAVEGEPVHLTPADAGWSFSGLRVLALAPYDRRRIVLDGIEAVALPLSGSCAIEVGSETFELEGRPDVFTRVSDFVYLPSGTEMVVRTEGGCELALPNAPATRALTAHIRSCPCRRGRGPRRWRRDATDQQLPGRRRVRGGATDRRRGPHTRRELVVVPAPQARRGHRGRGSARGDLLLPDPG